MQFVLEIFTNTDMHVSFRFQAAIETPFWQKAELDIGWKQLQNSFLARLTHPYQPKSGTAHLSANCNIAQHGQRYSPVINLWIFLQESTSIPNCDVFLLREERLFSAAERWRSCPRLNDVRSERASLQWFITSWVYERGAGCLSREWCALLLLHLKHFTANMYVKAAINQAWRPLCVICQRRPAVSIPAPRNGTNTSAL